MCVWLLSTVRCNRETRGKKQNWRSKYSEKIGINYECDIYNKDILIKCIYTGEVGWLPSFCYCTVPKRAYSITTPACHSRCFHRTAVTTVHYPYQHGHTQPTASTGSSPCVISTFYSPLKEKHWTQQWLDGADRIRPYDQQGHYLTALVHLLTTFMIDIYKTCCSEHMRPTECLPLSEGAEETVCVWERTQLFSHATSQVHGHAGWDWTWAANSNRTVVSNLFWLDNGT